MNYEKVRMKENFCKDIEDEKLVFNCVHYNLSPECFFEIFGE